MMGRWSPLFRASAFVMHDLSAQYNAIKVRIASKLTCQACSSVCFQNAATIRDLISNLYFQGLYHTLPWVRQHCFHAPVMPGLPCNPMPRMSSTLELSITPPSPPPPRIQEKS